MTLCFTLSMPNNNSWNGKWSGEGNLYAILRKFGPSKKSKEYCAKLLAERSWYYNFGDGWGASVEVKEVDAQRAKEIKKKSRGFAGYDWMVDSILTYGEILNSGQRKAVAVAPAPGNGGRA